MKKLLAYLLAVILCLLPFCCHAQIWEGSGGTAIDEGLEFGGGSGGGWTPNPLDPNMTHYVISFKDDNQTTSLFSSVELNENTIVDLSVFVPSRTEGYDFSHWEDSNGDPITSVTMTADTTVYAVWTAHTHSITWQITDYSKEPAEIYTSVVADVAYGSAIVASSTPTVPVNYRFTGWNCPLTMPDYDLLVEASIIRDYITFKIKEVPYNSSSPSRYPVEYAGTITNREPISYTDGVVDMGGWETWINEHFTPVMLKSDGTVDYELSRTNQNYKADGVTPSDIANASYDGNAMLKIKKFYISCNTEPETVNGTTYNVHTFRISDSQEDSSFTCWGFVDADGVEHDYAYYALYLCHVDNNNKLRSLSGITLSNQYGSNHLKKYTEIITAARANGNGWSISNIALENAIGIVMMMIFKDTNPMYVNQASNTYYQSSAEYNGMGVTGSRSSEGGFPYTSSSSPKKNPKVLWIENYWRSYTDNVQCGSWCEGLGALSNPDSPLEGLSQYSLYYKLTEPYDWSDPSSWSLMSETSPYSYQYNNHRMIHTVLYNNILFTKDNGETRNGNAAVNYNSDYGDIEGEGDGNVYSQSNVSGNSYSNPPFGTDFSLTELVPVKNGGCVRKGNFYIVAHYLAYHAYAKDSPHQGRAYGSGRLTYLPQPASLANFYSAQSLSTLSVSRNTLQIRQETESMKQIEPAISTDTMEVDQ